MALDPNSNPFGWYTQTTWIRTWTSNKTDALPDPPAEEDIRRIVREEIARLPVRFDVPDSPEGLD